MHSREDSDKTLASVARLPRHLLLSRWETSALLWVWGHGVRSCPHTAPAVTGQHSAPGCQPSPPPSSWVLWGQAGHSAQQADRGHGQTGPVGAPVVLSLQACLVWTLATVPGVHAFPYLLLSSAPKGVLPGPAADRPSPDQGPRAQAVPQSSPTRPRVSQLTASRPTQRKAMITAMPTKVPLSPPRGSRSQHTQAWRHPRVPATALWPELPASEVLEAQSVRAGRSPCPVLCQRQGHAEPTAAAHTAGRMCAMFIARLALTGPCLLPTTSRFTQSAWTAPAGARAASSGASATYPPPAHDAYVKFLAERSAIWTGPPSWQPAATRG